MSAKNDSKQKIIKCASVGDQFVGKSALFVRQFHGKFLRQKTAGVDFQIFVLKKGNEEIKFQFWDLGYRSRQEGLKVYPQTSILIMIYDITNRISFTNIQKYYGDYVRQGNKKSIIALVGNKKDLNEYREVSFLEGQELGKQLGVYFFEVSAFTGENVKDLYEFLIDKSIDTVQF
ncbi:Ras family small GTPase (macronuclear) [Tetrahymena thermophila SB210]|uniref:Ras family small GTPase n=2 Tax=Tetrahymena thermophila TaxID=5911 RepID=Q22NH7_TETTS|nr:Ras family small GTPase [Tetrahymena thermophila SB210]EAR86808.1 Ras family small GTPase [Tetrahymena thermophila SB210]BAJ21323.1 Rab-family small GTPase RabX1H [Tetrahymena thermophila]|eukprot:XP_001007053.1 Ras family small GTPase [Tetrahymena thermophila SB210]